MRSFLILVFMIICYLLASYYLDIYMCEKSYELYKKIDNDNDVIMGERYIKHLSHIVDKSALQYYRMGNIYDFVFKDTNNAHKYYIQALKSTKENEEEKKFLQTRLRDRINIITENDDNRYDDKRLESLNDELSKLESEQKIQNKQSTDISFNNDNKIKSLNNNIKWISDSQNVHDTNINNELRQNYEYICSKNHDKFLWNINDMCNYFEHIYTSEFSNPEIKNISNALAMLEHININGSPLIIKLNVSEKEFMSHIFTKIFNESNHHKKKILFENLLLNLSDSYSNGKPVCVTGRISRVLSSFTDMEDEVPNLGMLKTKPAIRNEIFAKAANIRNN